MSPRTSMYSPFETVAQRELPTRGHTNPEYGRITCSHPPRNICAQWLCQPGRSFELHCISMIPIMVGFLTSHLRNLLQSFIQIRRILAHIGTNEILSVVASVFQGMNECIANLINLRTSITVVVFQFINGIFVLVKGQCLSVHCFGDILLPKRFSILRRGKCQKAHLSCERNRSMCSILCTCSMKDSMLARN